VVVGSVTPEVPGAEADVDEDDGAIETSETTPPKPTSRGTRKALAALAYVVGALAAAWPLPLHLANRIAVGTEQTSTVPLFNLWSLRWNADRIAHLYSGYWNAPIFHPTQGAFAFSEPEPLTGLVFAPLRAVTGNQVLAYDLVLILALVLNGWAAARLCRRFGVQPFVALLFGLAMQRLPFVIDQLGVLQLVMVWPVLLALDAALRWAAGGGRRQAALTGVLLAATFLTCTYYGLFLTVILMIAALVLVRRSWWNVAHLVEALIAVGLFAVLALPMLIPQQHHLGGFEWANETIRSNSARWGDYLSLAPRALGAKLPWVDDGRGTGQRLYPGTIFLVLAVLGAWWTLRPSRPTEEAPAEPEGELDQDGPAEVRRRVWFLLAVVGVAGLVSLGLNLHLFGWQPYSVVRAVVPGFSRLRSPFRFSLLLQVGVLLLAAVGVDRLVRRPGAGKAAAVFLVLVALAEVAGGGTGLAPVPPESSSWSRYLDRQPGTAAVAMIPFAPGPHVAQFEPTTEAMLLTLPTGKPLVNGYSGFFPASYTTLSNQVEDFPDDDSLPALYDAGVRWVVVDDAWADADRQGRIDAFSDHLVRRFAGGGKVVYQLKP
jgi:hypothetical protein